MKRLVLSLLVLLLLLPKSLLARPDDLEPLRSLAFQEGGRLKPFDSFARQTARRVTGTRPFGLQAVMGLDPVEWVLSMMADPDRWRREPMIRVTHVGLREAARLSTGKDRYSYEELSAHSGLLAAWEKIQDKMLRDREAKLDPVEREVASLEETLEILSGIFTLSGIRVVPHPTDSRGRWFSLRDLDRGDTEPIVTVRGLRDTLLRFARDGDREHMALTAAVLSRQLRAMAPAGIYPAARDLRLEVHYNTSKPFRLAWLLYLLGFLSLLASLGLGATALGRVGIGLSVAGFVIHSYGIVIRMMIAGRPPVTNMYESLIWVAWGSMLFALIFECMYRPRYFAVCADAVAVIALILADSVPILDSSIEPLTPVLRDNLWLTIHVLTITLAYAAFSLAMAIAHVNLGLYLLAPQRRELLARLSIFLFRCLQVGVLLGLTGAVLGGWWASYSWGRFWGWDAKETSVFVSLIFYIAVIHGRMAGLLREFGTAAASVLGFLGVLWAWYGVNFVLGVGLHSYGFGSGGYAYVGSFVVFELLVVGTAIVRYRILHRESSAAAHAASVQTVS